MTATTVNPRAATTGRETRQFTVQPVELRKDGDGATTGLAGYASVTDSGYTIRDMFGDYEEIIRPGAFAKTLSERDDVRLLLNHEGLPLARTKSGTLTLREITDPEEDPQGRGQTGLWTEADLDPRSSSPTTSSWRWSVATSTRCRSPSRSPAGVVPDYTQRDILEVKLFDVSVVTYPANPATSVGLRAADVDRLDDDEARELMGRLQARFATQTDAGRSLAAVRAQAAASAFPPDNAAPDLAPDPLDPPGHHPRHHPTRQAIPSVPSPI
jgi:phage head maturation protease